MSDFNQEASGIVGIFRPGIADPKRLVNTTIGRDYILQEMQQSLKEQKDRLNKQHSVFIGPRGIGKTHLLRLLQIAVNEDTELNQAYQVISFPEENYRILTFADFILGVVEIIGEVTGDIIWQQRYLDSEENEDDEAILDFLLPHIKNYKKKRGKTCWYCWKI